MSDLHGDRTRTVVINTNQMAWQASPAPGVWRKRLERVGDTEKGMVTSIVRFDPGCGFPEHGHPLGEEVLVLEGGFEDRYGTCSTGTYTLLPNGSYHAPVSAQGCTLFVKLCQYAGNGRTEVKIDTARAEDWEQTQPGRRKLALYSDPEHPESARLSRLDPGTRVDHHRHEGGEEIFVIEGELRDENGRYPAGTWMRFADGTEHAPWTDTGCLLYVKVGHLGTAQ